MRRRRIAIRSSTSCTGCRRAPPPTRAFGFVEAALDQAGRARDPRRPAGRALERARSGVRRPPSGRRMGDRDRRRAARDRRLAVPDDPDARRRARSSASLPAASARCISASLISTRSRSSSRGAATSIRPIRPGRRRSISGRKTTSTSSCSPRAATLHASAHDDRVLCRRRRLTLSRGEPAAESRAVARRHPARLPDLLRRPRAAALAALREGLARAGAGAPHARAVGVLYDRGVATTAKPTALDPRDFLAIDALLDDEEKAIRDTVRQFVRERIVPDVGEWFEQGILPRELAKEVAAARPLRDAPRGLRPSRCELGRLRADVPRARGRRLGRSLARVGAGLARDVRDLALGLGGAEAALAAADARGRRDRLLRADRAGRGLRPGLDAHDARSATAPTGC